MTLHYTTTTTTTTLPYGRLHYTIPHYATLHDITVHYTTLLHHTTTTTANALANSLITLHYIYSSTTLHYNYSYTYVQLQLHYTTLHPEVVVRWPLQPLQPLQKTQLQPPFGPSLCHPRVTTTNLSYRFPIFETSATAMWGTTGITTTSIVTTTPLTPFTTWLTTINHYKPLLTTITNNN